MWWSVALFVVFLFYFQRTFIKVLLLFCIGHAGTANNFCYHYRLETALTAAGLPSTVSCTVEFQRLLNSDKQTTPNKRIPRDSNDCSHYSGIFIRVYAAGKD